MIEKVVACCAAVLLWFVLYRGIYVHPWSPGLPGEGPFKYVSFKVKQQAYQKKQEGRNRANNTRSAGEQSERWTRKDDTPKFMGMPLYGLNSKAAAALGEDEGEAADSVAASPPDTARPLRRARSRPGSTHRYSRISLGAKYN